MPVLNEGTPGFDELTIGLVNNMPDGALLATERQFTSLLGAAAGERTVRLRLYALPGIPRGPEAAAAMAGRYASTDTLGRLPPDALIVTGCEPCAPSLKDEPFWTEFTRLIDWAAANTASTLWSCLAAHAAVLHLDGIPRIRLPQKRSGVFECRQVAAHPLLRDTAGPLRVPHSRWNDLDAGALAAAGYTILTQSPVAGVDLFTKPVGSTFVFFQGHPEYDLDSIAREYRRDVARYLRGERPDYPSMPHAYFAAESEAAFEALRANATVPDAGASRRELPRRPSYRPGLAETWQASVRPVFSAWLSLVEAGRLQGRVAA